MSETPADSKRMWRLLDIARTLFSDPDPESVYRRILEAARELTGARYAALGVLSEQRDGLESFHTAGIDAQTREAIGRLPAGRGVLGVVISAGQALRIDDLAKHPDSYGFPPGHPVMTSFLGVPIHVRGEVWGNLYLTDKAGGFTEGDEEVATIVADWAATTVDLARGGQAPGRRWRDRERGAPDSGPPSAPPTATVLLVEDEPVLRTLVVTMLEEQGYLVLAAADGAEAIERAERHRGPVDLLITDVVMPGLSGPALAGRLREHRPGLGVLYMSGYHDSHLLSRGVEQEDVNLLAKPFTPNELIGRVRELTVARARPPAAAAPTTDG